MKIRFSKLHKYLRTDKNILESVTIGWERRGWESGFGMKRKQKTTTEEITFL